MQGCAQLISSAVFLAVVPKVVVIPGNVSEMQGGNIRAVCKATGSPSPEIQWNVELLASHHEVRQTTVRLSQLLCVLLLCLLGSSSADSLGVNTGGDLLNCLKASMCHTYLGPYFSPSILVKPLCIKKK